MTNREIFIGYIKNGGKFICSPQIGAGAGFDTRLAGKTWITDTTMEDTMSACRRFDMIPLYNMGLIDISTLTDKVKTSGALRKLCICTKMRMRFCAYSILVKNK